MEEKHIYNPDDYINLLDMIDIPYPTLLNQIKDYKLKFLDVRNDRVEWKMKFPMFVESFYQYVMDFKKIPLQEEFYGYYLGYNKEFFYNFHKKINGFNEDSIMEGVKARVYRSYPSIVRDICFNTYVKENAPKLDIKYNVKLDVEEGIDLMASFGNDHWGLCLYTDTSNGNDVRKKKYDRHTFFENVKLIEFPINFKNCIKHGDFFLYGGNEFNTIINRLREEWKINNSKN